MSQEEIKVLIADDHKLMREGLGTLLRKIDGVIEVGAASSGSEALLLTENLKPDIVLMDIKMPDISGIEVTKTITRLYDWVKVIAITMSDDDFTINEMFKAGASGYLMKSADLKEIEEAIFQVYSGKDYFCEEASTALLRRLSSSNKNIAIGLNNGKFDLREMEVIRMICQQKTIKECADELHVSERTVEGYRTRITSKMNTKSMIGVLIYALKNKLIDLEDLEP